MADRRPESRVMGTFIDLTGQTFGRLTVIGLAPIMAADGHSNGFVNASAETKKLLWGRVSEEGSPTVVGQSLVN